MPIGQPKVPLVRLPAAEAVKNSVSAAIWPMRREPIPSTSRCTQSSDRRKVGTASALLSEARLPIRLGDGCRPRMP